MRIALMESKEEAVKLSKDEIWSVHQKTFPREDGHVDIGNITIVRDCDIQIPNMTKEEARQIIQSKCGSSPGVSGITAFDLMVFDETGQVMVELVNTCLRIGRVPSSWSIVKAVQIPKKTATTAQKDVRILALQEVDCRIFLTWIAKFISDKVESRDLLHSSQKGFRKGYSYRNNVMDLYILQAWAEFSGVDMSFSCQSKEGYYKVIRLLR